MSDERVDGWWWDGEKYRRVDPHDEEMPLDTVRQLAALAGRALVPAADVPTPEERAILGALEAWLSATNYIDAWSPRDRLRKLGYAWMRARRAAKEAK